MPVISGSCSTGSCGDSSRIEPLKDFLKSVEEKANLLAAGPEALREAERNGELESGRIDAAALETRLTERFGDKAAGIVGDDGTVNFDSLTKLLDAEAQQQGSATSPAASQARAYGGATGGQTPLIDLLA